MTTGGFASGLTGPNFQFNFPETDFDENVTAIEVWFDTEQELWGYTTVNSTGGTVDSVTVGGGKNFAIQQAKNLGLGVPIKVFTRNGKLQKTIRT